VRNIVAYSTFSYITDFHRQFTFELYVFIHIAKHQITVVKATGKQKATSLVH